MLSYNKYATFIHMGYELLVLVDNLAKIANCNNFEDVEHTKIFDLRNNLIFY